MARDMAPLPSLSLLFAQRLNEEVYNFSTQLSFHYDLISPSSIPLQIPSSQSIKLNENNRQQQYYEFFSAISQKIYSILSQQFGEKSDVVTNSNSKEELIHYLQSMLDSSSSQVMVLTIQQQLSYLLAMLQISTFDPSLTKSTLTTNTVIEYIHSFLSKKIELFHQYQYNSNNSQTKEGTCSTEYDSRSESANTNTGDRTNGRSIFIQSMIFYISFIDYTLSIGMDRSTNTRTITYVFQEDEEKLFVTLQAQMKSYLSAMQIQEYEEEKQQNPSSSSSTLQFFETLIQEINIPMESREQLRLLYHQDYESLQLLKPFLVHLHSQQQQQQHHTQERATLPSNFVRPLPPLSNYSNQVDLFDFHNDYDDNGYGSMNMNANKSSNSETKADEELMQQQQQQDDESRSHVLHNTNKNENQNHCNDMLLFLHPADPFLRFMYMNTTALTKDNEETTTGSSSTTSASGVDCKSMKKMSDLEEAKITQILKSAFTKPLDANVEDEVMQHLNSATTISANKAKENADGDSNNTSDNNTRTRSNSSSNHKNNTNQRHTFTSCPFFEQILQVIQKCGLTPENLPKLVKNNHTIANKCLLIILLANEDSNQKEGRSAGNSSSSSRQKYNHNNEGETRLTIVSPSMKKEYLSSLVGMDMSLESMEVVYQLATYPHHLNDHQDNRNNSSNNNSNGNESRMEVRGRGSKGSEKKRRGVTRRSTTTTASDKMQYGEGPIRNFLLNAEYVLMFVSNFISSCENTQDRNRQYKYVRLLSVFLQTLIQKDIVQVEDLYVEVQQFCINFSKVEEAASLFKLLKESRSR